jgi:hypothetical protein
MGGIAGLITDGLAHVMLGKPVPHGQWGKPHDLRQFT